MTFSHDDLEMKLFGINIGRKKTDDKSLIDTQGNPISSENIDENRRNALKLGVGGVAATTLKTTGIGAAANFLMSGEAHAGAFINELNRVYESGEKHNGASKELCQDEILRKSAVYLFNRDSYLEPMRTILAAENQTSDTFTIDFNSWYCEPLVYVAFNTYYWKTGNQLGLRQGQLEHLETNFYHNFALMRGIEDFYTEHVRPKKWNYRRNPQTEKWLVESLFACAEEYPERCKSAAQEYLNGNFDTRVKLVAQLRDKFNSIDWKESDKLDRDTSGTSGKGPLNNWYRLLSAQWSAFFLTCHYDGLKNEREAVNINSLEKNIRKKIPRIRGPPYYWS